ncbi:MAG: hypothetical protein OXF23_03945 [Candidatus Dadabacteria bacterium]|nr:hypothetical protein [Candidatus Dadabacteria bacterium]
MSAHSNIGLTGILNIENRTENWMTSLFFCRLSEEKLQDFVDSLKTKESRSKANSVHMELFWRGVRDYRHSLIEYKVNKEGAKGKRKREIATEVDDCLESRFWEQYKCCFGCLRHQVCKHNERPLPHCQNYGICEDFRDEKGRGLQKLLYNNLRNTEMDIVFETDGHLFIGEAKYESDFGTDGKLVLVHQLIRQFVTASLLVKVQGKQKKVVPFLIVDDDKKSPKNNGQVDFMLCRKWLFQENIRTWKDPFAPLYA